MTRISVCVFVQESLQSPSNVVLSCDVTATLSLLINLEWSTQQEMGISGMFTQVDGEQDVLQRTEVLNMCLDRIICSGHFQVQKL